MNWMPSLCGVWLGLKVVRVERGVDRGPGRLCCALHELDRLYALSAATWFPARKIALRKHQSRIDAQDTAAEHVCRFGIVVSLQAPRACVIEMRMPAETHKEQLVIGIQERHDSRHTAAKQAHRVGDAGPMRLHIVV